MTRKHLGEGHHGGGPDVGYGEPDDGQDYVDRSHLDFDPAEGLLSGTALPHHSGGWLHDESSATGESSAVVDASDASDTSDVEA